MTSQPAKQTITMHILPKISRSIGNQTMEFGQVMEYNKRNIFLQKSCKKWDRETSSRCRVCFLIKLYRSLKQVVCNLVSIYFDSPQLTIKTNCINSKAIDLEICSILIFLEKGLGIVSLAHFVYNFSRKMFSCYTLLTDQISLSDCFFFFRYWSICVLKLFLNQVVTSSILN